MKKPHILFVTERHADCNASGSLSNSHHNLFGSLECSGLATYSNFFFEDHLRRMDDDLIRYHRSQKPDITVVTPIAGWGSNPTHRSLAEISKTSPLAFVWFDISHKVVKEAARAVEPFTKINIVLDNPFFIPDNKYIALWTPQDTRLYNDPCLERDIDVSFLGSLHGYPDRHQYLSFLKMNGVPIHQYGGQREQNLSPQTYAQFMQRSKIALNFSKTVTGVQQTKGRLWEASLCGAMVMEDASLGTSQWFEPFKDYVPFFCDEDLVEKINYYLKNPEKTAEIAANGKQKSTMHYSPRNWWSIVINKCLN